MLSKMLHLQLVSKWVTKYTPKVAQVHLFGGSFGSIQSVREFHATPFAQGGRRSGHRALEPKSRRFSKKQIKRKKEQTRERSAKITTKDHKKRNLENKHVDNVVKSDTFAEMVSDADKMVDDVLLQHDRPEGFLQLESKSSEFVVKPLSRDAAQKYLTNLRSSKGNTEQPILLEATEIQLSGDRNKSLDTQQSSLSDNQKNVVNCIATFMHSAGGRPDMVAIKDVISLSKEVGNPLTLDAYSHVLKYSSLLNNTESCKATQEIFDMVLAEDLVPSVDCWTALVKSKCVLEGPESGKSLIEQLKKLGVATPMDMFNHVLQEYVSTNKLKEAEDYFTLMHREGPPNTLGFTIMMKKCTKMHQMEKALCYFEEAKALDVPRDEKFYCAYLQAIAEAPHWMKGYELSIYEAMLTIEADQFVPTVELYNTIIFAFARARDAKAAEYYFWEMKEKGLTPTARTYEAWLLALAREQCVGSKYYGASGRFYHGPDPPLSEMQYAMMDVGAKRTAELLAGGLIGGEQKERGSRQFDDIEDLMDTDEHFKEKTYEQIMNEAAEKPFAVIREKIAMLENRIEDRKQLALHKAAEFRRLSDIKRPPTLLNKLLLGQISFAEYSSQLRDVLLVEGKPLSRLADVYAVDRAKEFKTSSLFEDEATLKLESTARDLTSLIDGKSQPQLSVDDAPVVDGITKSERKKQLKELRKKQAMVEENARKRPGLEEDSDVELDDDDTGPLFKELDNEHVTTDKLAQSIARKKEWRMISYGAPPALDYYTVSVEHRNTLNKDKADLILEEMALQGINVTHATLSHYMQVYSEALDTRAIEIFNMLKVSGFTPSATDYGALIRMYIRKNDLKTALFCKEDMEANGLTPAGSSMGMLIKSSSLRGMIPEALLLLEEAVAKNIKIEDTSVRMLRARMNNLGLSHPDMPEDPMQWIKDAKKVRWEKRQVTQRTIQPLRSLRYR